MGETPVSTKMVGRIPRAIKIEVLTKWLLGESRDRIAKEVQIGTGTVSGILKEGKEGDPEFNLLRTVAVKLKDQGVDVESFAHSVRLREILGQKSGLAEAKAEGLDEEQVETKIESLMSSLEIYCFKNNLPIKEFVDHVHDNQFTAEVFGVSLDMLPNYVQTLAREILRLKAEIEHTISDRETVLKNYGVTMALLREFERGRPSFEKSQELKRELEKVKKERDSAIQELKHERIWNSKEKEYTWSILEEELGKANSELGASARGSTSAQLRLNPQKLKDMVLDVYHRPHKYINVIRQTIDLYGLESKNQS
jgi:hypothetical protein